ncbi:hypothetical protein LTR85_003552 [Meristemomyces frigidus]|nr:hypothetical protein LTR85_003552 [Meristemomyces frigidus]
MTWHEARTMLIAHFGYDYKSPSAFSSWSVSLLWVLVHALRKQIWLKEPDVLIYVLNTEEVGNGDSRIYRATTLVHLFDIRHDEAQDVEQMAGEEYLVDGRLHSSDGFAAVRLEHLIKSGLFQCAPMLDIGNPETQKKHPSKWHTLLQRVHQVRFSYYHIDMPRRENKNDKRVRMEREARGRRDPDFKRWYEDLEAKEANEAKGHVYHRAKEGRGKYTLNENQKEYWELQCTRYINVLRALGRCFGPSWESTMTMAFACLHRREMWVEGMETLFSALDGLPYRRVQSSEAAARDDIEERVQFMRMLRVFEETQEG